MTFETIGASFLLVAASEMGDKTQLLAFSLAARYRRPWTVMAGILVATVLNHALAAAAGSWVSSLVPPRIMALVLGLGFIGFGLWTLKPDTLDEERGPERFGAFLTTTAAERLANSSALNNDGTVTLGGDETVGTYSSHGTLNGSSMLTANTYNLNNGSVVNANLGTGVIFANGTVVIQGANTNAGSVYIQTGTTTASGTFARDIAAHGAEKGVKDDGEDPVARSHRRRARPGRNPAAAGDGDR